MGSRRFRFIVLTPLVAVVAGAGPLAGPVARTGPRPNVSGKATASVERRYGSLPVSFAPNRGQAGEGTDYVAAGAGYGLALHATGASVALTRGTGDGRSARDPGSMASSADGSTLPAATSVVGIEVVGGNPTATADEHDRLPGRVSYLSGSDPGRWHSDLPTFARVTYPQVYPGIDVSWYGHQGDLEYDFTVAPGSDPGSIALGFPGAHGLSLAANGDLVMAVAGGELRQHAPRIYEGAGSTAVPVPGSFMLHGDHQVGFAVGAYDHSRPLVIDPVLAYSTFVGGNGRDFGQGIAVDSQGFAYVAGGTTSANFPTTADASDTTYAGGQDGFVTKLAPDGSLVYSTFLGGTARDDADTLAVDSGGAVYVRGITQSADFPVTTSAFDTTFNGGFDAYVAKLSPDGSSLGFASFLGGGGFDSGSGIAVDAQGSAYVVGITGSPDFPITAKAFQKMFHGVGGPLPPPFGPGDYDAYATKFTPDGSALAYSTFLGGSRLDAAFKVAVDPAGRAALTGVTLSPDFPTSNHAYDTTFNGGGTDAFVTKLAPDGSSLAYSTFLGGSGRDGALGIDMEPSGAVHVTGPTGSPDFPTTAGAYDTTFNGGEQDAYVARLSPNGSTLRFSTFLGGSGSDGGSGVAVDGDGATYVTGDTGSNDFPTTPGAYDATFNHGGADAYVAKLDVTGTTLLYSSFLGGSRYEAGAAIDVGPGGDAFVTGATRSSDFPTTPNALEPTFNGAQDAFVTRVAAG